jgi:hypothetical protein
VQNCPTPRVKEATKAFAKASFSLSNLVGKQKIGFDVQPEPEMAKQIVKRFKDVGQMPVFVLISLS